MSSSPPQRGNHRTFEGGRTVDGGHLGRGSARRGGARTLFSPSAMSLVSFYQTLCWKLLSPEKMLVTRLAAHFCRPFHPGGSAGYADSLVFSAHRGKRVSHTNQVTNGMYRPVPTCPITANYFSEKILQDVLQWGCKTSLQD